MRENRERNSMSFETRNLRQRCTTPSNWKFIHSFFHWSMLKSCVVVMYFPVASFFLPSVFETKNSARTCARCTAFCTTNLRAFWIHRMNTLKTFSFRSHVKCNEPQKRQTPFSADISSFSSTKYSRGGTITYRSTINAKTMFQSWGICPKFTHFA